MSHELDSLAIDARALGHRYGRVIALEGVSLTIPAGSATALVGPDGVGKSTLLGLVAGARILQAGHLAVLGGDMASAAHRERLAPRIAYMPQGLGRNLYPTLSVRENLDFFGQLYGQGRAERRARIERLLAATGLDPFPDRAAGKLSGGMKQKLSLCCALIHDPDLLVLDEPTTGVDPLSRRQFWSLIAALRAERPGMTVLVATAYMDEAERFERLVAIDRGRVLAHGPTAEVIAGVGAATLEAAYRALQQPVGDRDGQDFVMPPRVLRRDAAPAVLAEGLTRRFGDFLAVDRVSFRIERGEIFGFLGSNGCGKTTTMKMLTGLLEPSAGQAELLGRPVRAKDVEARLRVGYMSQSFSLYEELSVRGNLHLHARLYRLAPPEAAARVAEALERFGLGPMADARPDALPLGIRQRLQLAVACLHRPEVLILDEPTSGVDPAARDLFWRLLAELSRRDGVTIFVSTHFMNEALRCDRISLMHAGRVLAEGAPEELRQRRGAPTLEDAFVGYLEEAASRDAAPARPAAAASSTRTRPAHPRHALTTSLARIGAFARRELVELWRDRVRLVFALGGPLLLLITFGYGVTFDVEHLTFAVVDQDRSRESREFVQSFAGSRYFQERTPLLHEGQIDARLRSGELRLVIDIPPGFGRDLLRGQTAEVAFFLDGAMPFRAETARGYAQGIVQGHLQDYARRTGTAGAIAAPALRIEPRFRYNQAFKSAFAILPGTIMILLVIVPAMLAALGVVREREIGSIVNLAVSPATVGEFLIGKQLPYLLVGFLSFLTLTALAMGLFGLEVKGSPAALLLGALLCVYATTAFGLVVSTFVRSQIAAIIATAVLCAMPAINFSGYLYPAATLEGAARLIGHGFPALWFQNISLGVFAKGRAFAEFHLEYVALLAFGTGFLIMARLLLRKQQR